MMARTAILAISVASATANARPYEDVGGGAQLHYALETMHDVDHEPGEPGSPQDFVMLSVRLHGFVGGKRFGYHLGLDLAAGQTARPYSFLAYDVALFPLGVALRFAETSFLTLGAGIGAMGAVGTLDDAMTVPLEARFEIGRSHRLLGRARASYLFHADGRKDGGTTTSFADELEAMLAIRLGRAYDDYGFPTGDGYFAGVTYREALGARYVGVTLGLSIDMGTQRTQRRHVTSVARSGARTATKAATP